MKRTGIMGFIDFSGVPRGEDYAGSRKTMVLGEEIGMVEDLKSEQRELIEPLLHHYFNGCYSQLDYNRRRMSPASMCA